MGCLPSKQANSKGGKPAAWKSEKPMTQTELLRQREEFWETAPAYGGDQVIWDTLKAAVEGDPGTATVLLESAGITCTNPHDLSECWDERGRKYELPQYVIAEPSNLIRDKAANQQGVELMAR